ncbi:hypothetical protein CHH28_15975 [Bacterioplanes sanyensis]|uniref:Outer membrane protein beta-barrel domain-containing protein n=1 Tax=Bacterioplanes sanyensis TaxID=1249553 RepID=A0A222FNX0_9GAMM|nr:hypothetical protein [Bacterioplanes sanyensis]ASP40081.1 hypothetical protein CHH28_15975 [Bacterioplanes sanyensis]
MNAARYFAVLLLLSLTATAEPTNFRVGAGIWQLSIDPGAPSHDDTGYALLAEFPQSEHAGSRFLVYGMNGQQDYLVRGVETQLFWGWGLASPGFRLYTGPAWHWQKSRAQNSSHITHNGWGWHIGTGWQWRAITLDLTASYRIPDDYDQDGQSVDVTTSALLLSYRF